MGGLFRDFSGVPRIFRLRCKFSPPHAKPPLTCSQFFVGASFSTSLQNVCRGPTTCAWLGGFSPLTFDAGGLNRAGHDL